MTWPPLVGTFVRHAAYASVALTAALALLERLSPGSVLPYVSVAVLVIVSAALCLIAPPLEDENPLRSIVPSALWLVLSIAGLSLMLGGAGQLRMLVLIAFFILIAASIWAFAFTKSPEDEYEH